MSAPRCRPRSLRRWPGRQHRVHRGAHRDAGLTAYTASKHGVIGLTKSLAVELGRTGVTVNCVCPGPITTAMTAASPTRPRRLRPPPGAAAPLRRSGGGRAHDPELGAAGGPFVNGAVVVVDGGMTIRH